MSPSESFLPCTGPPQRAVGALRLWPRPVSSPPSVQGGCLGGQQSVHRLPDLQTPRFSTDFLVVAFVIVFRYRKENSLFTPFVGWWLGAAYRQQDPSLSAGVGSASPPLLQPSILLLSSCLSNRILICYNVFFFSFLKKSCRMSTKVLFLRHKGKWNKEQMNQ